MKPTIDQLVSQLLKKHMPQEDVSVDKEVDPDISTLMMDHDAIVESMMQRFSDGGTVDDESRRAGIDPDKAHQVEKGFEKDFNDNPLVKTARSIFNGTKKR